MPQPGDGRQTAPAAAKQLNSLGYYPPARALIVRGTTRYHSAASIKLKKQGRHGRRASPTPAAGPSSSDRMAAAAPRERTRRTRSRSSRREAEGQPPVEGANPWSCGRQGRRMIDPKVDPDGPQASSATTRSDVEQGDRLDRDRPRPDRRLGRVPDGDRRVRRRPSKCSRATSARA